MKFYFVEMLSVFADSVCLLKKVNHKIYYDYNYDCFKQNELDFVLLKKLFKKKII